MFFGLETETVWGISIHLLDSIAWSKGFFFANVYFFSEMNDTPWHFEFVCYYRHFFSWIVTRIGVWKHFHIQQINKNCCKLRNAGKLKGHFWGRDGRVSVCLSGQQVCRTLCLCVYTVSCSHLCTGLVYYLRQASAWRGSCVRSREWVHLFMFVRF